VTTAHLNDFAEKLLPKEAIPRPFYTIGLAELCDHIRQVSVFLSMMKSFMVFLMNILETLKEGDIVSLDLGLIHKKLLPIMR
jgi:hypothetical protein